MNIWAKKGHIVRTGTLDDCGSDEDKEKVQKYLNPHTNYTVEETRVGTSWSFVILKEVPCKIFNTIFFESVTEQSKEDDIKHFDYPKVDFYPRKSS